MRGRIAVVLRRRHAVQLGLAVSALLPACEGATPPVRAEHSVRSTDSASAVASAGPTLPVAPLLDDRSIDWDVNPVMRRLGRVAETLTETEYSYGLSVNEKRGVYRFDCSGMAQWVLRRAAPVAAVTMAHGLPQRPPRPRLPAPNRPRPRRARPRRLAPHRARRRPRARRRGRVAQARRDRLPEHRPRRLRAPPAGARPRLRERVPRPHRRLESPAPRRRHARGPQRLGFGTILLVADPETGAPVAYGWVALKWRAFETKIALGRALR